MNTDKFLPLTETTYYILLCFHEPLHGYAVMEKIEKLSKGKVKIAAGTMYGAIQNLEKNKLIQQVKSKDDRRKVYEITELGRGIFQTDFERLKQLIQLTGSVLDY